MWPGLQENGNVSEVIVSYGDQFDLIKVYGMPEIAFKRVLGACRNARFHADIITDDLLLPTLRILGPRLEKIRFGC